jgi:acetyltransferase
MVPGIGLNASFAHISPMRGGIAFVTQSGGMATAVLDWATGRGIGFSHFVSMGDMADVDFGDMLDYLAADPATTSVLLYMEAVTHARKFISAARACSRLKPVIVLKAGRRAEGAKAAASHTGALAGSDAVYDAAFRRAGLLRVATTEELFDAVETLAMAPPVHGGRLAILTNGGGPGVLAADALADEGGTLAELAPETVVRLDQVLPPTWPRCNPVDIIGDADADRYETALRALVADPGVDAALVLNCPTAVTSGIDAAVAVIKAASTSKRPVLTAWLGDPAAATSRALFGAHRIPTYPSPEQGVRGFMYLVRHSRNQATLLEAPPSMPNVFTPDRKKAREIIGTALQDGRTWLQPAAARSLLAAYAIPVVQVHEAHSPAEAAREAQAIGEPVALKISSRDITHKSDVGGVALELATPDAVREAAIGMLVRVHERRPDAQLEGFTVEPMLEPGQGYELIVGMTEDKQFGPVLMFGQGGTAVEVINDQALALPPLNMRLARELIERTRVAKQLRGYRTRPAVALDAVALTLVKVAQMVSDWPEIAELDINPLVAGETGVIALDARIRVRKPAGIGPERLAIRPYPSELEQILRVADGREYLVRPVRPEDGPALVALFAKMQSEDIRLRFFTLMRTVPAAVAARLTQIDYDRELALVAAGPAGAEDEILAIVHLICDPDNQRGEFTAMVRSDLKGHGLGYGLMTCLIEHARRRGVGEVFGEILTENSAMLKLCHDLGFALRQHANAASVMEATLDLRMSGR